MHARHSVAQASPRLCLHPLPLPPPLRMLVDLSRGDHRKLGEVQLSSGRSLLMHSWARGRRQALAPALMHTRVEHSDRPLLLPGRATSSYGRSISTRALTWLQSA